MKNIVRLLALAWMLIASPVLAASGTIFVNTGGTAGNSGTTDTASPTISGTGANWTTATTTINLDTNTNISSVAGCSAGTCDGSQAIFLTNATNSNRQIFWVLSYTGCTGSGACSIVVDTAPTCTTCTAQNWAIGGQYIFPGGSTTNVVTNALRAGDTIQFDNTPASKTSTPYIITASSGNSTSGPITIQGKAGVRPVLQITSTANGTIQTGNSNWVVSNLEIQHAASNAALSIGGSGWVINNVKITGTGSTAAPGISAAGSHIVIENSEIGPVGGSGVTSPTNVNVYLYNNYIHNAGVDCIVSSLTNSVGALVIEGNVLANCTGRGINLTGTPAANAVYADITGNTVYGNGAAGLEVADQDFIVTLRNNIFESTTTAINTVKWDAGNAQFVSSHGYNVFWNSIDSNSGVSGLTLNATEFASDPLFAAPGSNNFSISNASPAAGAGFMGSLPVSGGSTGFADIGAIQRAVTGGGGHIIGG